MTWGMTGLHSRQWDADTQASEEPGGGSGEEAGPARRLGLRGGWAWEEAGPAGGQRGSGTGQDRKLLCWGQVRAGSAETTVRTRDVFADLFSLVSPFFLFFPPK